MSRCRFFLLLLLLLLGRHAFAPSSRLPAVLAQTTPGTQDIASEDLFAPFTPQEMVHGRALHRSLPPLTPREVVVWSFRTARPGPFQ